MTDIDVRLREDVHVLGELLGETIRQQHGDAFLQKIEDITHGRMIDVAFDAVGIKPTLRACVDSLDVDGKAVSVGLSAQDIDAGPFLNFNLQRKQVLGRLGYKSQDIALLAEMLSYHRLDLTESISKVIPLKDVESGIAELESHQGNPIRILVKP